MDTATEYGWTQNLERLIEDEFEKLREKLSKAEAAVVAELCKYDPFRGKKSKAANFLEKLAIQVVSFLYFVERAVRAVVGSSFATKFLALFQKLTSDSEALIQKAFGQVPIPQPLPLSQADGTGGLTVAMLLTSADREAASAILPEGLELSTREELAELGSGLSENRYPLILGLGFNSDVRPVWNSRSFVNMNYLELSVVLPGVRLSRESGELRGPYVFIPALLLNSVTPTLLGLAFGFKKRIKRIKADSYSYRVADLWSGRPLLEAEVAVDPNGGVQLATNIPSLSPWLKFLDQPIVTRTWWGKLKFTFFHWDWLFTPTSAARVRLDFSSGEIPLAPKGNSLFGEMPEGADLQGTGDAPVAGKAYLMSVPWRLIIPFDLKVLEQHAGFWKRLFRRK